MAAELINYAIGLNNVRAIVEKQLRRRGQDPGPIIGPPKTMINRPMAQLRIDDHHDQEPRVFVDLPLRLAAEADHHKKSVVWPPDVGSGHLKSDQRSDRRSPADGRSTVTSVSSSTTSQGMIFGGQQKVKEISAFEDIPRVEDIIRLVNIKTIEFKRKLRSRSAGHRLEKSPKSGSPRRRNALMREELDQLQDQVRAAKNQLVTVRHKPKAQVKIGEVKYQPTKSMSNLPVAKLDHLIQKDKEKRLILEQDQDKDRESRRQALDLDKIREYIKRKQQEQKQSMKETVEECHRRQRDYDPEEIKSYMKKQQERRKESPVRESPSRCQQEKHYDREAVRSYIKKQRIERRKEGPYPTPKKSLTPKKASSPVLRKKSPTKQSLASSKTPQQVTSPNQTLKLTELSPHSFQEGLKTIDLCSSQDNSFVVPDKSPASSRQFSARSPRIKSDITMQQELSQNQLSPAKSHQATVKPKSQVKSQNMSQTKDTSATSNRSMSNLPIDQLDELIQKDKEKRFELRYSPKSQDKNTSMTMQFNAFQDLANNLNQFNSSLNCSVFSSLTGTVGTFEELSPLSSPVSSISSPEEGLPNLDAVDGDISNQKVDNQIRLSIDALFNNVKAKVSTWDELYERVYRMKFGQADDNVQTCRSASPINRSSPDLIRPLSASPTSMKAMEVYPKLRKSPTELAERPKKLVDGKLIEVRKSPDGKTKSPEEGTKPVIEKKPLEKSNSLPSNSKISIPKLMASPTEDIFAVINDVDKSLPSISLQSSSSSTSSTVRTSMNLKSKEINGILKDEANGLNGSLDMELGSRSYSSSFESASSSGSYDLTAPPVVTSKKEKASSSSKPLTNGTTNQDKKSHQDKVLAEDQNKSSDSPTYKTPKEQLSVQERLEKIKSLTPNGSFDMSSFDFDSSLSSTSSVFNKTSPKLSQLDLFKLTPDIDDLDDQEHDILEDDATDNVSSIRSEVEPVTDTVTDSNTIKTSDKDLEQVEEFDRDKVIESEASRIYALRNVDGSVTAEMIKNLEPRFTSKSPCHLFYADLVKELAMDEMMLADSPPINLKLPLNVQRTPWPKTADEFVKLMSDKVKELADKPDFKRRPDIRRDGLVGYCRRTRNVDLVDQVLWRELVVEDPLWQFLDGELEVVKQLSVREESSSRSAPKKSRSSDE